MEERKSRQPPNLLLQLAMVGSPPVVLSLPPNLVTPMLTCTLLTMRPWEQRPTTSRMAFDTPCTVTTRLPNGLLVRSLPLVRLARGSNTLKTIRPHLDTVTSNRQPLLKSPAALVPPPLPWQDRNPLKPVQNCVSEANNFSQPRTRPRWILLPKQIFGPTSLVALSIEILGGVTGVILGIPFARLTHFNIVPTLPVPVIRSKITSDARQQPTIPSVLLNLLGAVEDVIRPPPFFE